MIVLDGKDPHGYDDDVSTVMMMNMMIIIIIISIMMTIIIITTLLMVMMMIMMTVALVIGRHILWALHINIAKGKTHQHDYLSVCILQQR